MARASFISLLNTNMTVGQEYRVKATSYDSSYLHKIVIKCGSYSLTFDRVKGGVEKTFTVPLTWANAMPNATSMSGTITLTTYESNYSTKVGANDVETTKFNIPSSMVPSLSLKVSEAVAGIADKFGDYIQTKSKLKVAITASGAYGSTIKSYKTTIEGITYSGASFTSNALTKSGSVNISTTITDSRGKTATTTNVYPVLPYTAPTIYSFICNRSNAAAEIDDEGQYLKCAFNFAITSCKNLNDSSYSLAYKLKEATEWTTLATGNVYELNTSINSSAAILDTEESYDVRLTIADYFSTKYAYFELGTAFTLIDFNKNGKALAFGKVSEKEEGVEFGIKAWFKNGEAPNGAVDIPNSTDLNTVMDEGFYCIPTSSVSGSILNKPYEGTATGLLNVLRAGNEGQRVQVFMKCNKNTTEIYERHYYQEAWGSWVCIASGNKVLWSGGYYMTADHRATLSESVNQQASGIVLVFSKITDGVVEDNNFQSFFIPKKFISEHKGYGNVFTLTTNKFGTVATKYLYINESYISGHADNNATGTANGITYNNAGFVLRYVIGV